MTLFDVFRRPRREERALSVDGLLDLISMGYNGNQYVVDGSRPRTTMGELPASRVTREPAAIMGVGAVFGVVARRGELLSQAEFAWRRFPPSGQLPSPKPRGGDLFSTADLEPLVPADRLWLEIDTQVAISGSAFVVLGPDGRARVLQSRWCSIVLGSQTEPGEKAALAWDAQPVGLVFAPPDGPAASWEWRDVAHICPRPDPEAPWRGVAYLRPVVSDAVRIDQAGEYITSFFRNSATPNLAVTFTPDTSEESIALTAEMVRQGHDGAAKAFRTLFLGGGADVKVVGVPLRELDFASVNSAAVSALCQASGVPLPLLGIQEGLEGAVTYANSRQYMRQFADLTGRSFWALACRQLSKLVRLRTPGGAAELWYDTSRVSALMPEMMDEADAFAKRASAIRTLVDGGFLADAAVTAAQTGDETGLIGSHSGLLPVQLQPPGQGELPSRSANGVGRG